MIERTSSWNRLWLGAAVLGATVVAGIAGYVLAGWRLLDATYMVVITVFGVGYGEVRAKAQGRGPGRARATANWGQTVTSRWLGTA